MKHIFTVLSLVAALSLAFSSSAFAANPASFGMSGATSITTGSSVSVAVTENGDNVNVVTVNVSYDASKLQYLGASCGASFPNAIQGSAGITCYANPNVTGNGTLTAAVLNFRSIAAGSTTVSIAPSSKIASAGTNTWSGAATSFTTTSSSPQTPAPAANTSTPSASTGGSANNPAAPTKTTPSSSTSTAANASTSTAETAAGEESTNGDVLAATNDSSNTKNANTPASTADVKKSGNVLALILAGLAALVIAGLLYGRRRMARRKAAEAAAAVAALAAKKAKKAKKPQTKTAKNTPKKPVRAAKKA